MSISGRRNNKPIREGKRERKNHNDLSTFLGRIVVAVGLDDSADFIVLDLSRIWILGVSAMPIDPKP